LDLFVEDDMATQDLEYVYYLRDPRDSVVRYVGTTINMASRMSLHRQQTHSKKSTSYHLKKSAWLRELHAAGFEPQLEIVYQIGHHSVALRMERLLMWINRATILNVNVPSYDPIGDPLVAAAVADAAVDELTGFAISLGYLAVELPDDVREKLHHLVSEAKESADIIRRHMILIQPEAKECA